MKAILMNLLQGAPIFYDYLIDRLAPNKSVAANNSNALPYNDFCDCGFRSPYPERSGTKERLQP